MKLYDSLGLNPKVVRVFMAAKGITIPVEKVDLRAGENRQEAHLKRNPHGQMPTLELDDGSNLSEMATICEYLEDKHPKPPLSGSTPEEKAECRVWTRRVAFNICEHLANGYRFGEGNDFFKTRVLTAPEASPGLTAIAQNRLKWLDGQMADGREYLCHKRFTPADILLHCFVTIFAKANRSIRPTRILAPGSNASSRLIEAQSALQRASART